MTTLKVVSLIKPLKKGDVITTECLQEVEMRQDRVPDDSLSSASLAAGLYIKADLPAGTVLAQGAIVRGFQLENAAH